MKKQLSKWSKKIANRNWQVKDGYVTKSVKREDGYDPCGTWKVKDFKGEAVGKQLGVKLQEQIIKELNL